MSFELGAMMEGLSKKVNTFFRARQGRAGSVPDRDVETIRDIIYYQYAKIIARSVFNSPPILDINFILH